MGDILDNQIPSGMRKIPKGGDVTSAFGLTNCLYVDLISVEAERDVVNWLLSDDSPIGSNWQLTIVPLLRPKYANVHTISVFSTLQW